MVSCALDLWAWPVHPMHGRVRWKLRSLPSCVHLAAGALIRVLRRRAPHSAIVNSVFRSRREPCRLRSPPCAVASRRSSPDRGRRLAFHSRARCMWRIRRRIVSSGGQVRARGCAGLPRGGGVGQPQGCDGRLQAGEHMFHDLGRSALVPEIGQKLDAGFALPRSGSPPPRENGSRCGPRTPPALTAK
jgi:hypothetical protein